MRDEVSRRVDEALELVRLKVDRVNRGGRGRGLELMRGWRRCGRNSNTDSRGGTSWRRCRRGLSPLRALSWGRNSAEEEIEEPHPSNKNEIITTTNKLILIT